MIKKLSSLIALIALVLCLTLVITGCSTGGKGPEATGREATEVPDGGQDPTDAPTEAPTDVPATEVPEEYYETREYNFVDNADRFKLCGRTAVESSGVSCDWSAGGFAVNAYCRGSITLKLGIAGSCYFSVFIDGVKQEKDILGKSKTEIVSGLEPGLHKIEVFRQSEVRQGRVVLKSLTVDGMLLDPPEPAKLSLVFIGDSISSGFGTNPKTATGSEDHVDATLAYPFLTGRALDADLELVAVIGIGLVKGYVDETMGGILKYTDYYRTRKVLYEPARKADLVVINLGTNDATMSSNTELFREAAKNLIAEVRAMYGEDAPIVWIYNSMRADYGKHTRAVVEELQGQGVNIAAVKFTADTSAYGHPGVAAHVKDTEQLLELLKTEYGIG
ncbi:MAG: hypothetical protein J5950_02285 [Clostridia bacterium]|nr:hypothetical protein [Clostridia bacterium]